MNHLCLFAVASALSLAPAFAANSVVGRVSYVYPNGHRLILDSQREFDLAPNVDMGNHGVAEFVRLTLGFDGRVTGISPGPEGQAAYWTPRGTQS